MNEFNDFEFPISDVLSPYDDIADIRVSQKGIVSRRTSATNFQYIDFGDLTGFNPATMTYYTLFRAAQGNAFCLLNNYIPKGSKIIFDDTWEMDLIPQVPYFVPFLRKITLKIAPLAYYDAAYPYTVYQSDRLRGIVFNDKEDYFNAFNLTDSFTMVLSQLSSHHLHLLPFIGAKGTVIDVLPLSAIERTSQIILNHYSFGSYKPTLGYMIHDTRASDSLKHQGNQILFVPNVGGTIDVDCLYTNSPSIQTLLLFNFTSIDAPLFPNYSMLYDYKSSAILDDYDTTYSFRYDLPRNARDIIYRLEDTGAVIFNTINLSLTLGGARLYTIDNVVASAVLQGRYENMAGGQSLLVEVNTNSGTLNNLTVNFSFSHY